MAPSLEVFVPDALWLRDYFVRLGGARFNARMTVINVEGMTALGYPLHFIVLLGAWKVLGALTLLAPGLRLVCGAGEHSISAQLAGATNRHLLSGQERERLEVLLRASGCTVAD